MLSVGLEPAPHYLPAGFEPTLEGYESFLRLVIETTAEFAAAYKFNLAFFEALGAPGMAMLERVRAAIPSDCFVIADAKRGDIGTTAKMYATALFDHLGADAATVNPLMGRDSAAPFLEWADRLTYFLVLTSNPGAQDFLLQGGLYRRLAESICSWNEHGNCGFVIGATRGDEIREVRGLAPSVPFLVPGVGAQGGDMAGVIERGAMDGSVGAPSAPSGLLFHVTRGVLPLSGEGDVGERMYAMAQDWRNQVREAMRYGDPASAGSS